MLLTKFQESITEVRSPGACTDPQSFDTVELNSVPIILLSYSLGALQQYWHETMPMHWEIACLGKRNLV